ncbi:MAG: sugar transferase [Roseiflexus sp.]|jgi:lipopolysaccharide/colanic/teichoic acid biosynthesis glycosyltransferase|nr:sugar transferase [Roseiflexus sp.]MBO9334266.1 sugar transferase [Roseiflexus sp.]MBO9341151.1 sugar transferase [Roseiflexus sp.]MBO9364719.1 sugar transferase [Roseiflexus sp.]MBO9383559.1 sugar transferase [Roseiflexus sp.]
MATIVNRDRRAYSLEWIERYRPERQWLRGRAYRRAKRIMDLTLSLLAIPIVLPLFAIIALAIKIESPGGPVIFTQNRTGKSGRRFKMYKFRTMVPNAEELKKQLAHLNELQWPDFKITNDPRVTRVGKFLRKTSLDELPQIINVIRGDMSLVGPRPTSFDASTYQLWQTARLDVKPGLTGLWQVYGRGNTEFDERLRLDILYIEHRCLGLDIEILVRTALAVFQGRGAY